MTWRQGRSPSGKYGSRKVWTDGIAFDSAAEEKRYQELKLMLAVGEIRDLLVHVEYPLMLNGKLICRYEADFDYRRRGTDLWKPVTEDVKGMRSGAAWAHFRTKAKLFAALYGREIEVYPPAPPRKPRRKRA